MCKAACAVCCAHVAAVACAGAWGRAPLLGLAFFTKPNPARGRRLIRRGRSTPCQTRRMRATATPSTCSSVARRSSPGRSACTTPRSSQVWRWVTASLFSLNRRAQQDKGSCHRVAPVGLPLLDTAPRVAAYVRREEDSLPQQAAEPYVRLWLEARGELVRRPCVGACSSAARPDVAAACAQSAHRRTTSRWTALRRTSTASGARVCLFWLSHPSATALRTAHLLCAMTCCNAATSRPH